MDPAWVDLSDGRFAGGARIIFYAPLTRMRDRPADDMIGMNLGERSTGAWGGIAARPYTVNRVDGLGRAWRP